MRTRKGFREGVTSEISIAKGHFPSIELRGRGRKGQYVEFRGDMFLFWGLAGRLEADLVHL